VLDIRDLKFRYADSSEAMANGAAASPWTVDVARLRVGTGQQVLLTGSSGMGKSTLLHLIAGLIEPQQGVVTVAGRNMHELKGATRDTFRGRSIGMIFQTFNLLHGFSAEENVMAALMFADPKRFPAKTHREHARGLLRELGLERPDAMPEQLSVGQQQRVAVARAVACEPALVLADEPTASLDPENAAAAMDLIQQTCARHHAALLCVSHDPAMAARFRERMSLHELNQGLLTEAM